MATGTRSRSSRGGSRNQTGKSGNSSGSKVREARGDPAPKTRVSQMSKIFTNPLAAGEARKRKRTRSPR